MALMIALFTSCWAQEWMEDYQKASKVSKASEKPLLFAFLRSSECPWSERLQSDILTNSDFINAVKEEFVLVWIDLAASHLQKRKENEMCQKNHRVQALPLLLLADFSGEEILRMGYSSISPKEYADTLKGAVSLFQELKRAALEDLAEEALEELYRKAEKIGFEKYRAEIVRIGMQRGRMLFALLETYAAVVNEGKRKKEGLALRRELEARDPKNSRGIWLRLALLDFEDRAKKGRKAKRVIAPLKDYLDLFGSKDKKNRWKVEMAISDYLFSKRKIKSALRHAEAAYSAAPASEKPALAEAIHYLKSQHE